MRIQRAHRPEERANDRRFIANALLGQHLSGDRIDALRQLRKNPPRFPVVHVQPLILC